MNPEKKTKLAELLGIKEKKQRAAEINQLMQSADFWSNHNEATAITQELSQLNDLVEQYELAQTEADFAKLEKFALLSGEYDANPTIMTIAAGSGGVEAMDWSNMLMRMYLRYAERQGMKANIIDVSAGEEAGIKSATIEFIGSYAYGNLKAENGVHRLVRMSPFDADKARHTSFALIQVIPEITKKTVSINPSDLRIDVYRASGKGGQGVNTTDSAVRLTHLPSGIVVAVQNERSQLQNKATAMAILQSRLELLDKEKSSEQIALLKGDYREAAWGNQIRSYVLAPYRLVKDHRTNHESADPDSVLNGEIQGFIDAGLQYLKQQDSIEK